MKALFTGSRVYGTPRADSDLDMVLLVSKEEHELLKELCDSPGRSDRKTSSSFKFGMLNIIAVENPKDYKAWRIGTKKLKRIAPVTRASAVKEFEFHKKRLNKGE